ncbi:hypothetical protein Slip_1340 [Syntrophothermus lipocalidus DSM 12680]|uniref:Uncharacterized protein n=1 Tax=Syntrophothermus lipocalidus (strain DSM 12680 / TGB-C1) TaxID=643648 RepID=D7CN18_SYNLT|nr:hypothetical protein Slip_1340 [Syntrophothermus lipocalidus DSM 12680]
MLTLKGKRFVWSSAECDVPIVNGSITNFHILSLSIEKLTPVLVKKLTT